MLYMFGNFTIINTAVATLRIISTDIVKLAIVVLVVPLCMLTTAAAAAAVISTNTNTRAPLLGSYLFNRFAHSAGPIQ